MNTAERIVVLFLQRMGHFVREIVFKRDTVIVWRIDDIDRIGTGNVVRGDELIEMILIRAFDVGAGFLQKTHLNILRREAGRE